MLSWTRLSSWFSRPVFYSDWRLDVSRPREVEKVYKGSVEEVAMVLAASPFGASWEVAFCFATSSHDFF